MSTFEKPKKPSFSKNRLFEKISPSQTSCGNYSIGMDKGVNTHILLVSFPKKFLYSKKWKFRIYSSQKNTKRPLQEEISLFMFISSSLWMDFVRNRKSVVMNHCRQFFSLVEANLWVTSYVNFCSSSLCKFPPFFLPFSENFVRGRICWER